MGERDAVKAVVVGEPDALGGDECLLSHLGSMVEQVLEVGGVSDLGNDLEVGGEGVSL